MKINDSLRETLTDVFFGYEALNDIAEIRNCYLDEGEIYKKFLVIDLSKPTIEIPMYAKNHITTIIKEKLQNGKPIDQKVIIPLYKNTWVIDNKSFDAMLKNVYSKSSFRDRLIKMEDPKHNVFYGNKGLILDKDYKPILLHTLELKKVITEDESYITINKPILRVSPRIFEEESNIIYKGIISKMIPFYSNYALSLYISKNFTEGYKTVKRKTSIIIDDFEDKFFISVNKPKFNEESVNQCLLDNINEITQLI